MKRGLLVLFLAGAIAGFAGALDAGGGFSVFVPESLYAHNQGSISVETNFEYALGFGKNLSIPIGITYDKINGLMPSGGNGLDDATAPWFVADSVSPYVMIKAHVPLSFFYLEAFGGGALNWNLALTPIGQNIEDFEGGSGDAFGSTTITSGLGGGFLSGLGYGWQAGVGFGVTVKKIQVGVSATYRDIETPFTMTGNYNDQGYIALRGVSIGINGRVSL